MTESKRTLDKRSSIAAFAVLILLIFTKVLLCPLGDLDELWNYALCRSIAMGYVPYRDFGMVMTPLFTVLFSIPLLVSRTLLMYRLTTAVFFSVTAALYYGIATKATNRSIGMWLTLMLVFSMDVATYNSMLFLCVLIVFILLSKKIDGRISVSIGAVSALGILSRQTTGVFLMIAVMLFFIVDRSLRKYFLKVMAGAVAVLVVFAVCLVATGSFTDFWDCCLFALLVFSSNAFFDIGTMPYVLLIVAGAVIDVVMWRKDSNKISLYHLILGAVLLTVTIPIVDYLHVFSVGCWFIIPVAKLMSDYLAKYIKPMIVNCVNFLIVVVIMFLSVYGILGTVTDDRFAELRGIPMHDGYIDGFAVIDGANNDFRAEGNRVVVLSSRACIFSIMDEQVSPRFDVFLRGTQGTTEPVSIVAEVCGQDDTIILMPDDYYEENWQNPDGVVEYITNNCTEIARYGDFAWYSPVS